MTEVMAAALPLLVANQMDLSCSTAVLSAVHRAGDSGLNGDHGPQAKCCIWVMWDLWHEMQEQYLR